MPPGVVTVTSTVPAAWAGVTAVSWVGESTVKLVAAVVPKSTALAPLRFVPTTSTVSPPAVEPIDASTAVTLGPAAAETAMVPEVPVIEGVTVSVAVMVWSPTVTRVAENVPTPLVKVAAAGSDRRRGHWS